MPTKQQMAITVKCMDCAHEYVVEPATDAFIDDRGAAHAYYSSRIDFCDGCGSPEVQRFNSLGEELD